MIDALFRLVEMPWFYWTARWIFWGFASWVFDLRIEGREHVPRQGGLVLAVNHISAWDPPLMGSSVPREISFMAKKELFDRTATALLFRGLHAFPVDRSRSDIGAIKEAMRRLGQGRAIGVFIQGTRNRGDKEALDGASYLAVRAGVPLQPAAIWREGRKFRVRFGEPFVVEGRGRPAIRAATAATMERIDGLLPSHTRVLAPDEEGEAPPAPRAEEGVDGSAVRGGMRVLPSWSCLAPYRVLRCGRAKIPKEAPHGEEQDCLEGGTCRHRCR